MGADVARRSFGLTVLGAGLARAMAAQGLPRDWRIPDDDAIRRMLRDRLAAHGVGIVVGVVDGGGRRVVAEGVRAKGDPRPLDGDTVFEIGSVTKVLTALLLADMAARGELSLDEPLSRFLPAGVRAPQRHGREITLTDLATHTSGLPGLPANFAPTDPANPYADYTLDQLWAFLDGHALPHAPGRRYAYSNLGFGLLGQALGRRAGGDYAALIEARITAPLGLSDTAIALTPALRARLATGHDPAGEPAANWDLPTLAGAGALRSTANDMLSFLAAALGLQPHPLTAAMAAQLAETRPAGPAMEIALGWHVARAGRMRTVWHNGGTGGYRSFIGFDPDARVGVVVLTNMASEVGGDDIGFHLLTGRRLAKLSSVELRTAVSLAPEQLEGLAGRYVFGRGPAALTVIVEGGRVRAQLTGQPAFEIYPESPTRFFWKVVDAQVTFDRDGTGRARALTLRQGGRNQRATRSYP